MSESRERLKRNTRKQRLPRLFVRLERKVQSLSELLAAEGYEFPQPQSSYSKEFYERLPIGLQRRVLKDLSFYLELLEKFQASGGSLQDSNRLTWAYLKNSGLQPCSSTFSHIDDDDVIEVFNSEYIQIFRNMKFFEFYRGSLLDLCILDWMSLYKRDAKIEEQIFIQMGSCFRQPSKIQQFQDILKHEVSLRFSETEPSWQVFLKHRSSLIKRQKKSRRVEAVLVTSRPSLSEYLRTKVCGLA